MLPTPLPPKAVLGMIHLAALPGTPGARLSPARIVAQAVEEAHLLVGVGFDGIVLENMHDRPYLHGRKGPETVAVMTAAALAVRVVAPKLPIGVQVLSGGNHEALAIAHAAGLDFIRCENFVFAHVADEGLLGTAEAGGLLRYRRAIGADGETGGVAVFCDLKKKHASHAITADISIADAAEAAVFFGADGVVVTGAATGKAVDPADLAAVRAAAGRDGVPVLVGSGVTPDTAGPLFQHADALIVGSSIKKGGRWFNGPDPKRCRAIVEAAEDARRMGSEGPVRRRVGRRKGSSG